MNYAEMSDFEINGMVASATQRFGDYTQARGLTFIHEYGEPVGEFGALCLGWKEFDPCKSWADAGPIIAENQISLVFDADLMIEPPAHWVMCRHVNKNGDVAEHYAQPNKPLRAAMIVFLMMQEPK